MVIGVGGSDERIWRERERENVIGRWREGREKVDGNIFSVLNLTWCTN